MLENRPTYERIIDNIAAVWPEPDEEIINYYDTPITAGAFFAGAHAVARSLHAMGVREGDSIAASLESVPEFMELFLACELLGCSIKNFLERGAALVELVGGCSAKLYFTHDYIPREDAALVYAQTHIEHIVLIDPLCSAADRSKVRPNIHAAIAERYAGITCSGHAADIRWADFLTRGQSVEVLPAVEKGHVLFSAFTSGTTGKRKEVLHTSESMLGVIRQIALVQAASGERPTWLLTLLPPTLVACVVAMMWHPLAAGKKLILDPFCKLEDIDLEVMHYKPNGWAMIPLFFETLLDSRRIPADYDMSHLKQFGAGAEPLTVKLAHKTQAFFDAHHCTAALTNSYGQSEGGSGYTIAIGKELVYTSTSGIPYIETIISIFAPGTTQELKYGEVGEICKAGPGLMKGYADPALTAQTLKVHPDGQLWLHTGDHGFMTEEGLLFVLGRDGHYVFPGQRVFPLGVENKVLELPEIKHAIIVAGDDPEHAGFEKLHLFVVLEEGCSEEAVLSKLHEHIETALLPAERPQQIFVIDKKPVRGFKTDRRALKELYHL